MNVKLQLNAILAITTAAIIHTTTAKYLADKPDILTPCHLKDPHFKDCYSKNFQALFREWKDGVPGLKSVGSFDPVYVKSIVLSQDPTSSFTLNADLSNITITGGSKVVIKDASFDPSTLVLKVKLFFPKLHSNSDYKLNGRILTFVLNGKGKDFFEVENCLMNVAIHLKLRDEHGFTFTDVEKLRLDIKDVGGFHIQLDNLFNGEKVLEESTNAFFNENWRDLFAVLRPAITQAVEAIFLDRLKKIFSYIPAKYFVADIESAAQHYG